jgi:hypothetical protein
MTGAEIAAFSSFGTALAAMLGLQVWKCSRNSQVEESKDNLVLDVELFTVEGNKFTIKGLHVQANEVDKARSKNDQVDGSIGDKGVSMATLRTIGGGGVVAAIGSNTSGDIEMAASSMQPTSPTSQHSHISLLPESGPRGTQIVASKAEMVDDLVNTLLQFVTAYTSDHLSDIQASGSTVPLLGGEQVEGDGV